MTDHVQIESLVLVKYDMLTLRRILEQRCQIRKHEKGRDTSPIDAMRLHAPSLRFVLHLTPL
jgi:hypothetical protein